MSCAWPANSLRARPAALRASTALRKTVLGVHGRQRYAHGDGAHEELV